MGDLVMKYKGDFYEIPLLAKPVPPRSRCYEEQA